MNTARERHGAPHICMLGRHGDEGVGAVHDDARQPIRRSGLTVMRGCSVIAAAPQLFRSVLGTPLALMTCAHMADSSAMTRSRSADEVNSTVTP